MLEVGRVHSCDVALQLLLLDRQTGLPGCAEPEQAQRLRDTWGQWVGATC